MAIYLRSALASWRNRSIIIMSANNNGGNGSCIWRSKRMAAAMAENINNGILMVGWISA